MSSFSCENIHQGQERINQAYVVQFRKHELFVINDQTATEC